MGENNKVYLDTNVLLNREKELLQGSEIYILSDIVLGELDDLVKSNNREISYKARQGARLLETLNKTGRTEYVKYKSINWFNKDSADVKIIKHAKKLKLPLWTEDRIAKFLTKVYGVELFSKVAESRLEEKYRGFTCVTLSEEEFSELYNHYNLEYLEGNPYNLTLNQYVILKLEGSSAIELYVYDGKNTVTVETEKFKSSFFGQTRPKDIYQKMAMHSLRNNDITVLRGRGGAGKSYLAITYIMDMLESGKKSKLIVFCNPVEVKNSASLGLYPGDRNDKVLDTSTGSTIISKFGDEETIRGLIESNMLEIVPISNARGYETPKDSILWFIESQNADVSIMKLVMERVGENTTVIIDGDVETQLDMSAFTGQNNGMNRLSEVYRGESYYGEVELQECYRSPISRKASEM